MGNISDVYIYINCISEELSIQDLDIVKIKKRILCLNNLILTISESIDKYNVDSLSAIYVNICNIIYTMKSNNTVLFQIEHDISTLLINNNNFKNNMLSIIKGR